MRIFISAGEPSGDLHGANLVAALRRFDPSIECVGFGGDRMADAGCQLLYPLCRLALMWFARVLANGHIFLHLISRADRYFRRHRPDAVVLIDYPGFHWWLARRAHEQGIPVFYFVPPQLWAWGDWRVRKMRRYVDHVLCTLPFEEAWYQRRGVAAHYVGHPYFDELGQQQLDSTFLAQQRAQPGPVIGLLPGSRSQEVERNLPTLVRSAARLHQHRQDTRFLMACYKTDQQAYCNAYLRTRNLPIGTYVERTKEIIELAHACVAVSGSVGLELLYRAKPTAVVYRVGRIDLKVCRLFMKAPHISLVNLLAGKELFPEFLSDRCESEAIADHLRRWLDKPASYHQQVAELLALRDRVGHPGACERAAGFVLRTLRTAKLPRSA